MGISFRTGYVNLVLRGPEAGFFLVSGRHRPGFPWGDPPGASDVVLVLWPDQPERTRRFVAAGATLEGLVHEVGDGRYAYRGPAWELPPGCWRVGLGDLAAPATLGLAPIELDLELALDLEPLDGGVLRIPFTSLVERMQVELGDRAVNEAFGDDRATLGMVIDPAAVSVRSGHLRIAGEVVAEVGGARGQAESGDYVGLRRPAIRYHYLCGLAPDEAGPSGDGAITIRTDVLDPGDGGLVADTIAHLTATFLQATADRSITWSGHTASVGQPGALEVIEPVMTLVWDHLETAVLERTIARVRDGDRTLLACEEDAYPRAAHGPASRSQVLAEVFVERDPDHARALDRVLAGAGFDALIADRARELGVAIAALRVVVKPNFMFMYSLEDPSTYTDPTLVERLIDRLWRLGCRDIAVVEAQSAYGNYFEGREVERVAAYVGYQVAGERYRVVDLTREKVPHDYGHRLGHHVVGPTWRDADLRISFAKNKTHSWAYYTLGIKNTYGCLPMQDKLREYHDRREIYYPTIDALRSFPVHFSLIDASLSADGQFGIFADRTPQVTDTIIGGRDLVGVDWVGAAKMGLDPMLSRFMREAVFAFGKPAIAWRGERGVYPGWRNVERAMTEFWDRAEERPGFAELIFRGLNEMDGHFPRRPMPWYARLLRALFGWVRQLIFKRPRPAGVLPGTAARGRRTPPGPRPGDRT